MSVEHPKRGKEGLGKKQCHRGLYSPNRKEQELCGAATTFRESKMFYEKLIRDSDKENRDVHDVHCLKAVQVLYG